MYIIQICLTYPYKLTISFDNQPFNFLSHISKYAEERDIKVKVFDEAMFLILVFYQAEQCL